MYWILKENELGFIWDENKKVMFQVENEVATIIKPTLEQLTRFRPNVVLVEKTTSKPKVLV